jgi:signal transduction histidine kinase
VTVDPARGRYPLGRSLEYVEDAQRQWTLADVTAPPVSGQFLHSQAGTLNFGITASAYWVRFQLRNDAPTRTEWLLEVDWPLTDFLQLYAADDSGRIVPREGGDHLPFGARAGGYRNPLFRVTLDAGVTQTFHLRFEGADSLFVPLVLWTPEAFMQKRLRENSEFGFFLGVLLVMIFYNLLVLLSIRDASYLYYVLAMTGLLVWQLCYTGLASQYLWPNHPWWANHAVHLAGLSTGLCFGNLVRTGLMTKVYAPALDVVIRTCVWLAAANIILSLVSVRLAIVLSVPLGAVAVPAAIVAAIQSWRRGFGPAWDFLLAWLFSLLALMAWVLDMSYNVFNSELVRTYVLPIGFIVGSILLSRGLTRRINSLREERDRAHALAQGIGQLLVELSQCQEVEELALRTGEELTGLLRPVTCTIYLRRGERYMPIFVRGPWIPPNLQAQAPLAHAFARLKGVADVTAWSRHPDLADAPADREVLEGLKVAVVVPIYRRAELSAVVCLGAKQSAESYTATELRLLGRIADKMSSELLRFDDAKLASIGEGMARMMHDLRNPLTVASGYMELIAQARTPDERDELTQHVQRQFHLMERMAGDVLAYARGEATLLVGKIHVNDFMRGLRSQLEVELKQRPVRLVIEPEFKGTAYFDDAKLLRAIENLARNAADAMPEGGTLRVAVRSADGRLVFEVSDTGMGIPPEVQARLFTPFATAGKSGGTGLGLVSVKKAVEEHHGTIAVQSMPGQGTCFRIEIPLGPPPTLPAVVSGKGNGGARALAH